MAKMAGKRATEEREEFKTAVYGREGGKGNKWRWLKMRTQN